MARYTGPMTRKSRRLGVDLVGGDSSFERRPYPPGQHGRARIKESEYRSQLQEKQKARFTYGVMEKQFHNYYVEASRRAGKTGDNLLQLLECRLDNVVYRAGFARTRRHARQLVSHGHVRVNGLRVDRPAYAVSPGDVVSLPPGKVRERPQVVEAVQRGPQVRLPGYLALDPDDRFTGRVIATPQRADVPFAVAESAIVEFYAR